MKNYKLNQIFRFLFPFFFISGIVLIILGFNDKETINLNYEEANEIHYNVYLKDNVFFDTPYLEEDRTYIANLIDYIDINFHYSAEYNRPLTGNVNYKYVAIIRANKKEGNGYYWEKKYDLTKSKKLDIKNNVNVSIDDNIKVNYNTYNEILGNFKKEYGISTDGELKIAMEIDNEATFAKIEEPVRINSEMSLSIPLLEQSLEVSINKDASSENNILSIKEKSDRPAYLIFKITGIILVIIGIIGLIDTIKNLKFFKRYNMYEITLDKITKNYDSIIATVNNLPDVEGLKIIEVSTFEELIDVYNEVRMPINYYQNEEKTECIFIIINDGIAWVYSIRKSDFLKRVDNNEKEKADRKRKW